MTHYKTSWGMGQLVGTAQPHLYLHHLHVRHTGIVQQMDVCNAEQL